MVLRLRPRVGRKWAASLFASRRLAANWRTPELAWCTRPAATSLVGGDSRADRRRRHRRARRRYRAATGRPLRPRSFEKAPQITEVGAGLSLWSNTMVALRRLGLDAPALVAGSLIERTRTFLSTGEPFGV